jgi:hypothetical protein
MTGHPSAASAFNTTANATANATAIPVPATTALPPTPASKVEDAVATPTGVCFIHFWFSVHGVRSHIGCVRVQMRLTIMTSVYAPCAFRGVPHEYSSDSKP